MMNLGLLLSEPSALPWLKRTLAGTYQLCWHTPNVTQTLAQQVTKPVDLLLVQLESGWSADVILQLQPYMDCCIMLFSADGQNHMQQAFRALGFGARDYVEFKGYTPEAAAMLLRKIKQQAVLYNIPRSAPLSRRPAPPMIVAIGASTGGPSSLFELIRELPADFNAAIVIVQHMDGRFSTGLADWLERASKLKIKLIAHREKAEAGTIYIAGADIHLKITEEGRFIYSEEPEHSLFKPSIDVFFESLAQNWQDPAIGVLLTGMGQDGAVGLKLMRNKGWMTIAQDEATSVVYGMPKAAVRLEAATEVLPLDKIAGRLIRLCNP